MSLTSYSPTEPRIAVITGASSGIGRAASIALHKTGWTVVLVARRQQMLEETKVQISDKGERVSIVVADLAKEQDIQKVFDHVKDTYGGSCRPLSSTLCG